MAAACSIDQPAGDAAIAVDAAIAQEGPIAPDVFQRLQVDFTYQDLFFVVRGLCNDPPEGIA